MRKSNASRSVFDVVMARLQPAPPIFRYRLHMHRAGEERPWQYTAPVTEDEAARLWNNRGHLDVEPLTIERLEEALEAAYLKGASDEKFGRPNDQLYRRLGYRRCKRRRAWTIADRKAL